MVMCTTYYNTTSIGLTGRVRYRKNLFGQIIVQVQEQFEQRKLFRLQESHVCFFYRWRDMRAGDARNASFNGVEIVNA